MLAWDLFKHYLFSRRAGALIRIVAWLCLAGVTVGVMSLVVVLSVMNGFNDAIKRRLLAVEPHLVVRIPGVTEAAAVQAQPVFTYLRQQKGVHAHLFENQDVILRTVDGFFGGAVAQGVDEETLSYILREVHRAMEPTRNANGTTVSVAPVAPESWKLEPGEVLMGVDLARSLGVFEGDRVVIVPPESLLLPPGEVPPFERVLVKSLLTTNIAEIDAKAIFYARDKTFLSFKQTASKEVGIEVRLPDPQQAGTMKKQLVEQGTQAETWMERNSALFHALKMEKIAMGAFLGLSALIASFSIITVLVLLLTQKRKDIGVFMSLGLSPQKTRIMFLKVGLMLSFIGIGGGILAGLVICFVIDRYPLPILPDIYYDSTIPASVDPEVILGILVVSGIISFLSAWLPVRRHTHMQPAEALRSRPQEHAGE